MKLIDVAKTFQTDDDCLAYMESLRWPDGVIRCPTCGSDHISKVVRRANTRTRTRVKKDGTATTDTHSVRTRIYQCLEKCTQNKKGVMVNAQFSATSGTLFNDSHLPLTKWLMALAIIVDAKKSISAKQLQEHLDIGSYRTAWYMAHRIRKSMEEKNPSPMTGVVEMDETYIYGKSKRRGIRPPRPKKDMVIGLRERKGRVRFFHVPDVKTDTIKAIVDKNIDPDVLQIQTDSAVVYPFALHKQFRSRHRTVNHSTHYVSPEGIHTNTIESAFSLLKRGLIGSFHRVSIDHLHRYLSEFEYRFNERMNSERFEKTLNRMLTAEPMPYQEMVSQQQ